MMGFFATENDRFTSAETLAIPTLKPPQGGFSVEMMGFLGAGNNPMVGMTVAVAVAVSEALK